MIYVRMNAPLGIMQVEKEAEAPILSPYHVALHASDLSGCGGNLLVVVVGADANNPARSIAPGRTSQHHPIFTDERSERTQDKLL